MAKFKGKVAKKFGWDEKCIYICSVETLFKCFG